MAIRVVAAAVVLLTGCTAIPVADRKSQAPVCNPHVIAEVNGDANSTWVGRESDVFKGMTMAEFRESMLGLRMDRAYADVPVRSHKLLDLGALPEEFNAYEKWPHYMHPIRDQMRCGSCWAFAASEVLSDRFALASKGAINHVLSPEDMVSCDKVDQGCNGGLMANAYDWLVSKQGGKIVTEQSYPYTSGRGSSGTCKSLSGKAVGAVISSHKMIAHDEDQMAAYMLKNGPLPIAVDAQSHWQTYTGGIVSNCNGKQLDHGVMAVGYTSDYWIVKNSWGATWGESGYIRLAYGSNQCGLNQSPTAPIASGSGPVPPSPPAPTPRRVARAP